MSAWVTEGVGQTAIKPIGHLGEADSPLLYLHCGISLAGNQWLGDETFRLLSFEGQESISEPFDYQLQLRGNTSPRHGRALTFESIIGRPVTVGLNRPFPDGAADAAARFARAIREGSAPGMTLYNGLVTSFAMEEPGVYRLGMKPALWRLTLTNRYCVHAQMNVRDVIEKLMRMHYIDYSLEAVSGHDNIAIARTQDWLQAGESDFEFLRRMMSKAHIYYYFRHTGQGHTVVFANRPAYPKAFGDRPLRYTHTSLDEAGMQQDDVVFQYAFQQSLTSTGVNGRFTHQENAADQDPVPTFQTFASYAPADTGELPFQQYRSYQYGMSSATVREYVRNTASSMAGASRQLTGSCTCSGFRVGYQFTLKGEMAAGLHPSPVRPSLEGVAFVLNKVQHKASADGGYSNSFESTDANAMLSPFSVGDTQMGAILARVVDKAGHGPIDWRFYEPKNFDPEMSRLRDTQAAPQDLMARGVYVEFSTPGSPATPTWVKLAAHMTTVPEIGVTVLVTRANDESELPEVQSVVQANGSLVITPAGWSANTHVGSSYSTSYGDGQSIRFGRTSQYNLNNAVKIVNSTYDTGDYRDTSYSQGASYSYSTSENGADGLLSRSESYGSTYNTQEAKEVWSKSTLGGSISYSTVNGDTHSEDTTTGTATRISSQNIVLGTSTTQMQSNTNMVGLTSSIDLVGLSSAVSTTGASMGVHTVGIAGSVALTGLRSDAQITGLTDSTSVTGLSTAMSATGTSTQVHATGLSSTTSLTGVSTQVGLTGSSNDISLTGASTRMSVTGASTSVSVTGSSSDVSVTASETRFGFHGSSTSVDVTGTGASMTIAGARLTVEIVGISCNIPIIFVYV
ncbi:type VI secretion system secreted protein VgrG [Luteibacter sp. Sphag1AF]|uniref:phage late control D family protein n=1 Tax=Luteibacter sp. Sphag1AF TaxID=2587031 RepID=UPI00160A8F20|nr:phage late control D family protein [Luteibacter sp. Sphag1AF]MBB3228068.1 type VI secretion system secreted protein VgrG [Luteibacter sp. Sphag1AF]